MKRMDRWALAAILLTLAASACAQSLADAARQNQQQKSGQPSKSKVYTNDDLDTARPPSRSDSKPAGKQATADKATEKDKSADARRISAEIVKQKQEITRLQGHFDRLQKVVDERANLETPPNLTPAMCAQEPERCEGKREAAVDLSRTGNQLEAAKTKLTDLQDKARKQGYSAAVWDP